MYQLVIYNRPILWIWIFPWCGTWDLLSPWRGCPTRMRHRLQMLLQCDKIQKSNFVQICGLCFRCLLYPSAYLFYVWTVCVCLYFQTSKDFWNDDITTLKRKRMRLNQHVSFGNTGWWAERSAGFRRRLAGPGSSKICGITSVDFQMLRFVYIDPHRCPNRC